MLDRVRHVFPANPSAIYLFRLEHAGFTHTCASESLSGHTGYTMQEILASPSWRLDHMHPDDRARWQERLSALQNRGYLRLEFRFRHKNGGYVHFFDELKILRDTEGRSPEILETWWHQDARHLLEETVWREDGAFRLIFEKHPFPMYIYDVETLDFLEVNEAAVNKYGYSREEFFAMRITDIRPPEDVPALLKCIAAREKSLKHDGEWRHRLKNGQLIDVDIISNSLILEGRRAVLVLAHDISRRKALENILRRAHEFQDKVLASTSDAIFALDLQGRFTYVNQRALEISGYPEEQLIGRHFSLLLDTESTPIVQSLFEHTTRHGEEVRQFRIEIRRQDGTFRPIVFNATPLIGDEHAITGVVGTAHDLSRDLALQAALETSQEKFRLLIENIRDYAVLMLDPEGRILSWNPGAERIFGYAAEEVIHRPVSVLFAPEERRRHRPKIEIQKTLRAGLYSGDVRMIRKDGSLLWAVDTVRPLHDSGGGLLGFVKVVHDITERKALEEEILRLNRELGYRVQQRTGELQAVNQEMESFCYSVSHDLRAPLRAIDGFSMAFLEDYGCTLDKRGKSYLERVRHAAQRMSSLIDDLLSLSRITRSELRREAVDLSRLAHQVLSGFATSQPQRQIECKIQAEVVAQGDRKMLQVVMEHLLNNACKFTQHSPHPRVEFGVLSQDGKTVYFVRDNGVGFDMRYADKLFGAFQRLHGMHEFEGNGIGLVTVQHIVHRHGGEIWAEGEIGKGATFYFTLPAA